MSLYPLYTYRDLEELRKIQDEREVYTFMFADTKDLLDVSPDVCIDISALIYFLQSNKNNIQPVYVNFSEMTEDTRVIINESQANVALDLLPFLFSERKNYFEQEETENEEDKPIELKTYGRQKVYRYNTSEELDKIVEYANEHNIPITTFSRANGDLRKEFEQFNSSVPLAIMDFTSVSYAIEDNKNLIYVVEQFLGVFPNLKVISKTTQVDAILKYFPLFFDGQDPVSTIIPDLIGIGEAENKDEQLYKITSLSSEQLNNFVAQFDHNLIGHRYFKERLQYALKTLLP